jgi:hypothetical protein
MNAANRTLVKPVTTARALYYKDEPDATFLRRGKPFTFSIMACLALSHRNSILQLEEGYDVHLCGDVDN